MMKATKYLKTQYSNWIFNHKTLRALPTSHRRDLDRLKKTALFVAIFDGVVFGAVLNVILGIPFFYGMIGMAALVLLLETFFLSPGTMPKWMRHTRIFIALIMVAFHSLLLDSYIFDKDIQSYLAEQNSQKSITIDSAYQSQVDEVNEEILKIRAANDSLHATTRELNDRVYAEISMGSGSRQAGYGIYAKKFEEMGEAESARIAPRIAANDSLIHRLEGEKDMLMKTAIETKEKLVSPSNRGLMDRIDAVFQIVFINGNSHTITMYLLIFALMLAFELLPFLKRIKSDAAYTAYDTASELQSQHELDESRRDESINREINQKIRAEQAKHELEKRSLSLKQESEREIEEIKAAHEKLKAHEELTRAIELDNLKTRGKSIHLNGVLESVPKRGRPPKKE